MSELEELYRRMLVIRRFEEELAEVKKLGEVPGSIHLCIGQEAIPVGVSALLLPDDYVTATYRGHGWAIERGSDLAGLFGEIMGRASSVAGGRAASPYLSDASVGFIGENSIVGAGVPIALGAALSCDRLGGGRVSVVSIGDGAMNQGNVHEALNMAAVLALPLVVVVENNGYSEMVRIEDMVRVTNLAERGAAYGIPAETVDGNDPVVVARAAAVAIERARTGGGPSIIEARTQRLVGHYSGDAQHYRPAGEVAAAREVEPLVRARAALLEAGRDAAELDAIAAGVDREIQDALAAARLLPLPDPTTVMEHVYA
ncbi:thiamine pyrophosphate-dependent dehydrogenase E1 component subunit alpha [Agromyces soli]|uniref:Thiamine pyrophosphate-dependent dehydrogenase E1 component subunit alpha n=1 Tax=Agromyces soli TaxID=659012 RepID=A0ABY4AVI5_9MICO|nr:thiamine pyrophosphate-dependent dehydrogenase E1 component subunit alpha [Agromyces soli]UOE27163.1 thiamine pyrophosphate-dependent dehydrogenase E1 component subunit alpha [Agromyces soli]